MTARPRTILLVDPDPASAAVLGPVLRKQGFHVQPARDGSRALQLAVLRSPDLVLLDDGTPLVSASTVARILRSNPRTSAIPIVRTGRAEPAHPDEPFLRKPFDVDAVLAVVTTMLAATRDDAGSTTDAGLEGSLEQLPLVDLVQMLSANRRTGRLLLHGDGGRRTDAPAAVIVFDEGCIVDATGQGVCGEKAFVRILAVRSGQFTFAPGRAAGPPRIARRTAELLLDGLRQSDEIAAVARTLPAPSATLALTSAPRVVTAAGADEVRRLLATPKILREVLDRASAKDVEVVTAIAALLAAGEVETIADAAVPSGGPELLAGTEGHALRARLLERRGAVADADHRPMVAKVLLVGAGELATRSAVQRLSRMAGFREARDFAGSFGTAGTIDAGELRVDVVVLPADPALQPLWTVLAAGGVCAIVLAPAEPVGDRVVAIARSGRLKVGVCGPAPDGFEPGRLASTPGWCGYVGSDPIDALRALLSRAAARDPASPA